MTVAMRYQFHRDPGACKCAFVRFYRKKFGCGITPWVWSKVTHTNYSLTLSSAPFSPIPSSDWAEVVRSFDGLLPRPGTTIGRSFSYFALGSSPSCFLWLIFSSLTPICPPLRRDIKYQWSCSQLSMVTWNSYLSIRGRNKSNSRAISWPINPCCSH